MARILVVTNDGRIVAEFPEAIDRDHLLDTSVPRVGCTSAMWDAFAQLDLAPAVAKARMKDSH